LILDNTLGDLDPVHKLKKEKVPLAGFAMVNKITPASLGHPIFVCVFPILECLITMANP